MLQAFCYFDNNNNPQIVRERSTVGSASATGSVGGRTTWASGSDVYDPDKMSEDQSQDLDMETNSMGGFSDEAASLVGFGEGARTPARQQSGYGSPVVGQANPAGPGASGVPSYLRDQAALSPMSGASSEANARTTQAPLSAEVQGHEARMIDGMTYDDHGGYVDTTSRTPPPPGVDPRRGMTGTETAERIMRERIEDKGDSVMGSPDELRDGGKGLGKFGFEGK